MVRRKYSRGYFIGGLLFAIILVAAVVKGDILLQQILSDDDIMPVKAVQIDGALQQLTRKQIADMTGRICAGQNIAALDLSVLEKTLMQEPWVSKVSIKKKMPDTLVVSIVEHVPAAYWNEKGLYDAKTASVFYPRENTFTAPLVRLGAKRDNLAKEVYDSAVLFIRKMRGSPYQMFALDLDNVHSYTLTLNNKPRTRLILGRGRNTALVRLERFLKAFSHTNVDINDVAYVDLRYDVGFAVGKVEKTGDKKNESVSKKQQ